MTPTVQQVEAAADQPSKHRSGAACASACATATGLTSPSQFTIRRVYFYLGDKGLRVLRTAILHLSDLHYASEGGFLDDDKTGLPVAFREHPSSHLLTLIESAFGEGKIALVAVSGDTTTCGRPEGHNEFRDRIGKKLVKLTSNPLAICIVPGNHDVKWGIDTRTKRYYDEKFESYTSLVKELGATSSLIPTGTMPIKAGEELQYLDTCSSPLYVDHNNRIIALCINSALRCGELNRRVLDALESPAQKALANLEAVLNADSVADIVKSNAEKARLNLQCLQENIKGEALEDIPQVTSGQLAWLGRYLSDARAKLQIEWAEYFKVAILHHHLVVYSRQSSEHKPFEIMSDAGRVLDVLASYGFHLVLTGHKHQPYIWYGERDGKQLIVSGGMTIGGQPATGSRPGARYIDITSEHDVFVVKLANLYCDALIDPTMAVQDALANNETQVHCIPKSTNEALRRNLRLPQPIENAIGRQIYGRFFYKTDVRFIVRVEKNAAETLQFTTTLSYTVTNLKSTEEAIWYAEFNYDTDVGKVIDAKINGNSWPADQREFLSGRGLRIRVPIDAGGKADILLKIQQIYACRGAEHYTSYNPADSLEILLQTYPIHSEIDFSWEVLYDWSKDYPVAKTDDGYKVTIKDGILPYQGVRLTWRPKGDSK